MAMAMAPHQALLLLAFLACSASLAAFLPRVSAAPASALVESVPGFSGSLPSKHYAGCVFGAGWIVSPLSITCSCLGVVCAELGGFCKAEDLNCSWCDGYFDFVLFWFEYFKCSDQCYDCTLTFALVEVRPRHISALFCVVWDCFIHRNLWMKYSQTW